MKTATLTTAQSNGHRLPKKEEAPCCGKPLHFSVLTLGLVAAAPASAKPTDPPNCHGQVIAFLAQVGGEEGIHGIGNLAKFFEVSVQEGQDLVREFCESL